MLHGFYVFHKKHPSGLESLSDLPQQDLFAFKTCLRHIYICQKSEELKVLPQEFEIFRDQKAYEFLLEILCGLHSPVVGETEVFGQFKSFWQSQSFPYGLQQIFSQLITDVKRIRGQHLVDLGGQSYGSLIRKDLRSPAHVAILGAGSFVKDLLPWVYKDENTVSLYARQPEKAQKTFSAYDRLQICPLKGAQVKAQAVIVAAPLSATEIEALVMDPANTLVIDLRGESRQDACTKFSRYKSLQDFFAKIEANQSSILKAKAQAILAIGELSGKRYNMESPRPFGWEDICVW